MNFTTKRLFHGGAWALSGKGAIVLLALATNAILARMLVPDALGEYFVIFSIVSVFAMVAQIGLNQAVVKSIAESIGKGHEGKARAAILNAAGIFLPVLLVITVVFATVLGPWLGLTVMGSETMAIAPVLIAAWIAIIAVQGFMAEVFRGFHDIRRAVLLGGVISHTIALGGLLLFWVCGGDLHLTSLLRIIVIASAISVVVGMIWLGQQLKGLAYGDDYPRIDLLRIAGPAWVTGMTVLIMRQADMWILGASVPHQEVALYGAAARFSDIVLVPLMIINSVVPPLIAELYTTNHREELEKTLRATAAVTTLLAIMIVIPIVVSGRLLMEQIYGPYYGSAVPVLVMLTCGNFVNVWTGSCGVTLMMTGHQTTYMMVTLFSGIVMVISCMLVVTSWGAFGVATVVACTTVIQNLLSLLAVRLHTGLWTAATVTTMFQVLRSLRLRQPDDIFR